MEVICHFFLLFLFFVLANQVWMICFFLCCDAVDDFDENCDVEDKTSDVRERTDCNGGDGIK